MIVHEIGEYDDDDEAQIAVQHAPQEFSCRHVAHFTAARVDSPVDGNEATEVVGVVLSLIVTTGDYDRAVQHAGNVFAGVQDACEKGQHIRIEFHVLKVCGGDDDQEHGQAPDAVEQAEEALTPRCDVVQGLGN